MELTDRPVLPEQRNRHVTTRAVYTIGSKHDQEESGSGKAREGLLAPRRSWTARP